MNINDIKFMELSLHRWRSILGTWWEDNNEESLKEGTISNTLLNKFMKKVKKKEALRIRKTIMYYGNKLN